LAFAKFDWNYLLQQITFVLASVFVFSLFYFLSQSSAPKRQFKLLRVGVVFPVLVLYAGLGLSPLAARTRFRSSVATAANLDLYAGYDVSFRVTHKWLSPVPAGDPFFGFLVANTNIARSVYVAPVDIHLVSQPSSPPQRPPHIFIIVVDSLRRDYLPAYNPAVTFTPSIAQFAAESTVIQHAFTNYGGTALSEPAIWAGAMLLHKQYIVPFLPMNSLEKLIETSGYHSFVTKDTILQTILTKSFPSTELDAAVGENTYDLCHSLEELTADLESSKDGGSPIFLYTQPQNLHVSVINRQGRSVPAGESYPGFDAAYASRLHHIDGCFGQFIQFLKRRQLYSGSVVILTADHGDSLGEDGRWGHAYTLFPEVVRVPLIIHLPESVRLYNDPNAVAFLKDITPSLYYLLNQTASVNNPLFGHPLFTHSANEQAAFTRNFHLLASSYGPVYGVLSGAGNTLYIADAINYKDYLYDLSRPQPVALPITEQHRSEFRELINSGILSVDQFYHFIPTN
jgi:hypothetical protein